jgi:hypothetical protein
MTAKAIAKHQPFINFKKASLNSAGYDYRHLNARTIKVKK